MLVIIIWDLKFVRIYYTQLPNRKFYASSFIYSAIIVIKPDIKSRFRVISKDSQSQAIFLDTNVIKNSFITLSCDRSVASSKVSSPQSTI
jgi:hypothetical protein